MLVKYRLPAVVTISIMIMMLIFNISCNNASSTIDVQVYTPEESAEELGDFIVENEDGLSLNYFGGDFKADFRLEQMGNMILPSAIDVQVAISESGFYNEELFKALKIYLLPYRVPSIFGDLYIGGFVTDGTEIVLFAGEDKDDLQQLVLHEIGHIAYKKANPIEMDEYSAWRLEGAKNTCRIYEIDGEIVVKEDSLARHILKPDEVVAEDFSFVYSKSPGQPLYENYLDSPSTNQKLKADIKKRLDKLFENQK